MIISFQEKKEQFKEQARRRKWTRLGYGSRLEETEEESLKKVLELTGTTLEEFNRMRDLEADKRKGIKPKEQGKVLEFLTATWK